MSKRSVFAIAVILGAALSSQVSASNNQQGGDMPPPPPQFSSLDSNSDDVISIEEFSAQNLPGGLDADSVFAQMDSDGDESVSKEEFESFRPPRPSHN